MSVKFTDFPDYNQFVQTYFVNVTADLEAARAATEGTLSSGLRLEEEAPDEQDEQDQQPMAEQQAMQLLQ
jgi:hypothetical protein|tara:strand:- start:1405 stop:1614 length:210 start_codon:yes stop_codon:yes gene_type:complete